MYTCTMVIKQDVHGWIIQHLLFKKTINSLKTAVQELDKPGTENWHTVAHKSLQYNTI